MVEESHYIHVFGGNSLALILVLFYLLPIFYMATACGSSPSSTDSHSQLFPNSTDWKLWNQIECFVSKVVSLQYFL